MAIVDHKAESLDAERFRTFRGFVRGMFLFALHVLVILAILAIVLT